MLDVEITKNIRLIWEKFERGDHCTDAELRLLLSQAKDALPYLQSRPEFRIALVPTVRSINDIEGYLAQRKSNREEFVKGPERP